MTKDTHQTLLEKAKEKTEEKKQDHSSDGEFESLDTCKAVSLKFKNIWFIGGIVCQFSPTHLMNTTYCSIERRGYNR